MNIKLKKYNQRLGHEIDRRMQEEAREIWLSKLEHVFEYEDECRKWRDGEGE